MTKDELLGILKSKYDDNDLPSGIKFNTSNVKECKIILDADVIKEKGMQDDSAAFEGWTFPIYNALGKDYIITLEVNNESKLPNNCKESQHYNRFLYRIMKFQEQYKWFRLSKSLSDEAERFKKYLTESGNIFVNNLPSKEASDGTKSENKAETYFSEKNNLMLAIQGQYDISVGRVYRQLPTGLFENEKRDGNEIFTKRKSAIDLWNIKDNTFNVFELKADNPMVGIISEIFFYSNYFYDLLTPNGLFTFNQDATKYRGYDELRKAVNKNQITNIVGVLLADKYHSLVNDEVIQLLNDNNTNSAIGYVKTTYDYQQIKIKGSIPYFV